MLKLQATHPTPLPQLSVTRERRRSLLQDHQQDLLTNIACIPPGSIAVGNIIKSLGTHNESLIGRVHRVAEKNSGTLEECDGCGQICLKDNYLLFGEVQCYCKCKPPMPLGDFCMLYRGCQPPAKYKWWMGFEVTRVPR